jgi:hypothetical protein
MRSRPLRGFTSYQAIASLRHGFNRARCIRRQFEGASQIADDNGNRVRAEMAPVPSSLDHFRLADYFPHSFAQQREDDRSPLFETNATVTGSQLLRSGIKRPAAKLVIR